METINLAMDLDGIMAQIKANAKDAAGKRREEAAYEEKRAEEIRAERWAAEKSRAGIPPRYMDATFKEIGARGIPDACTSLYEAALSYAERFEETRKRGSGLIFAGAAGRMKTTLAIAIMQRVMSNGVSAYFISMPELLDRLLSMARGGDPEERMRFEDRVAKVPLLVLDDFGAEYPSGWVLNKVDAIVTHRYNWLLPTIITTNMTPDEMKGRYVARIVDRLRSAYDMLVAEGASLRESGMVLR